MYNNVKFLTVSQVNEYIKMLLDSNPLLDNVWLRAEISNFTNHYKTGHFYFSLKDDTAIIRAVMFRSNAQNVAFEPQDGMKVLVHGRIGVFVRDGQYQIYVDEILPDGIGAVYLAFEQLKRKLEEKGLFAENNKKTLPKIPTKIGIITSPTGAAIQDILNIIGRRFKCAEIYIYPAQVQGATAAAQLVEGLRFFNKTKKADVIIIGRGGGSAEDLWAFNDEKLAYAVYESHIPVISAVGHESDFTICDFVADMRAPTPSAAAELAVPKTEEISSLLENLKAKMTGLLLAKLSGYRKTLEFISGVGVFARPAYMIADKRMELIRISEKTDALMLKKLDKAFAELSVVSSRLEALSPLSVLARGYGVVSDENGNLIKNIENIEIGKKLKLKLNGGTAEAEVIGIKKEKRHGNQS